MYRPFRINLQKFILEMLPPHKRKLRRVEFIYWFLRPLYRWYREELQPWYDAMQRDLDFNSQVILLQWILNDKFDPEGEGITVETNLDKQRIFIYPEWSGKPKFWVYNPWRVAEVVSGAGWRRTHEGSVWQSTGATTGNEPGTSGHWTEVREITWVRDEEGMQALADVIVTLPEDWAGDQEQVKVVLKRYLFSGLTYEIIQL